MTETFHEQKGPMIRDLKPDGRFVGFYQVRYKQLDTFRDPSRGVYLTLVLSDRSGQMRARVWEDAEALAKQVEPGAVVKIEGQVETYLDQPQIRVLRLRTAQAEEYDQRDFVPSTERDVEAMLDEVHTFRKLISEPNLKALVDLFYTDNGFLASLRLAPAARRVHHAYLGGLLENKVDMLRMAQAVLDIYPQVDSGLLLAGILLHDIGKLREYRWETEIETTDEGQLLGHIVITDRLVSEALAAIPDFPDDLALRLRHMLIAQRGRYEWGSPRKPQTMEAVVLHHLADLNAQINRFQTLLENRPAGTAWTPYDRLLGRQLYAGSEGETEEADEDPPE